MSSNQAQIDFWNGPAAARWVKQQTRLDRAFLAFDGLGFERAAPRAGERVIDIGCGCGASTLGLGERVGSSGKVLGIDISAPMLARARERAAHFPWITFEEGDAAARRFSGDADLVYSRFGSMFFTEPVTAFANVRTALRPGGRICLVCWRPAEENLWYQIPRTAAETVLAPLPPEQPGAPGPFAFASRDRLVDVLGRAGFQRVAVDRGDATICMSETGLDDAADFAMNMGAVAKMIAEARKDDVERVRAAIAAALAGHVSGSRVELASSLWLATAYA